MINALTLNERQWIRKVSKKSFGRFDRESEPDMKILRKKEVCRTIGVSPVTLWRMIKRREFPEPIQISIRAIGWSDEIVENWIKARPHVGTTEGNDGNG
jgi:prophage regulatory protein